MNLKNCFVTIGLALGLAVSCLAGPTSLLQRSAFFLGSPSVVADLKLTGGQIGARDKVLADYNEKQRAVQADWPSNASDGVNNRKQAEMEGLESAAANQLLGILTAAQTNRLKQIGIQHEGLAAMGDAAVARDLGLTAAQSTKIRSLLASIQKLEDDYSGTLGDKLAAIPQGGSTAAYQARQDAVIKAMKPQMKQLEATKAATNKQILGTLSPAQKAKWKAMQGKPVK